MEKWNNELEAGFKKSGAWGSRLLDTSCQRDFV